MAILGFQLGTIGQAGEVPVFVYFNTDDTLATVTTAGYLNRFVLQGNAISPRDMALIVTSDHGAVICNIVHVSGNWSLVEYGGGSGGDAWLVGGNRVGAASFLGTTDSQNLEIGTGDTTTLLVTSAQDVILGSLTNTLTINNSTNTLGLQATNFDFKAVSYKFETVPLSVTGFVFYYNPVTSLVSYGAVPGGGSEWNLTGTNSGAGLKLGTNTTDGWDAVFNSVVYASFDSGGVAIAAPAVDITSQTADLVLSASATKVFITGQGKVNIDSVADAIEISCPTGNLQAEGDGVYIDVVPASVQQLRLGTTNATIVNIGSAITTSTIDGTILKVPNLPNASAPNNVFYDVATKQLSYAAVGIGFDWNITGTNSGGALLFGTNTTDGYDFQVNSVVVSSYSTTQLIFGSMAFGVGLVLTAATGNAEINGHSFTVSVDTGDISLTTRSTHNININGFAALSAVNINIGTLLTGAIGIGNNASVITQAFNGWTAAGIGDIQITTTTGDVALGNMGGGSGSLSLVGHTSTSLTCDVGNIDILAQGANSININGSAGTVTINIGTVFTTGIDIGSSLSAMAFNMASLTSTCVGLSSWGADIFRFGGSTGISLSSVDCEINTVAAAYVTTIGNAFAGNNLVVNANSVVFSPNTFSLNTVSTLHLGSGAAMDLGSGATIAISAPGVNINASATNVTTIGNVLAGNVINLNSADIKAPNLPPTTGGEKIVMIDVATGQLRISP